MQIPSAILTLVIGMVLALGGLWIGQNINLLPIDASANAPIYDELFKVLFTIGSILFIGIVGLLVFSLIRFRRRSGQLGDGLAIEGNLPLEIFWTAVPAVVVLFVRGCIGGVVDVVVRPWVMGCRLVLSLGSGCQSCSGVW